MLRGWKEICQHTGLCRPTLKKFMRYHGFPITFIEGKTITSKAAIEAWLAEKIKGNNFSTKYPQNLPKPDSKKG